MLDRKYADFAWEQTAALLAIDSPSGYTAAAAKWVQQAFADLGFGVEGVFAAEPVSNIVGGLCCFTTMWLTVYKRLDAPGKS